MSNAILATMRDEGPFVLEWLAYHRAIGFDKFLIFSNDCTDGTREILDALDAAGVVKHVSHEAAAAVPIAEKVAAMALDLGFFSDGDWVIWLDADEYLNIHAGQGRVQDLIERCAPHQGICISWRLFGTSGQDLFRGRCVSPDFTRCSGPGSSQQNVKTLFRFEQRYFQEFFQHKPIMKPEFWADGGMFLRPDGEPFHANDPSLSRWRAGVKRGKIAAGTGSWKLAQINHYAVRTEPLFAMKAARGRIGLANTAAVRYDDRYFRAMNTNDAEDRSILRWQSATGAELDRLQQMIAPAVAYPDILFRHYSRAMLSLDEPKAPDPQTSADKAGKAVEDPQSQAVYEQMHRSHHEEMEARAYSNAALASEVMRIVAPTTVVDVGCGIGLLLAALKEQGCEITGVEGLWLQDEMTIAPRDCYVLHDLEQELALNRRFDLAISIEVAEHLDPARADSFVTDLCRLSDVVLFSAAVKGQGGKGHKNEQWQSYWAKKFEDAGYGTYDPIRARFRRDERILPWFQQNVLLFIRDGHALAQTCAGDRISPQTADMILPTYHMKVVRRLQRSVRQRLARAGQSA
ncbi:glycosyltransferase family 2 protein [Frigidibacter sp. SD6-1]|uniref:glycosyltransferase family 2 protein n=1 Tax=Frigidibacter sp. SD6-1 TaxID=3032581 RepID=UPI0024DFE846|nr:glycosyltransferase family 2 protein [Frigidibacter sp. SD6-1]